MLPGLALTKSQKINNIDTAVRPCHLKVVVRWQGLVGQPVQVRLMF